MAAADSFQVKFADRIYPVTILGETVQEDHGMDAFARAVAEGLRSHSRATGHEACAMLCRSSQGTWGAIAMTIGSHMACPISNELCPRGMASTGVGIHSHPSQQSFRVNRADQIVLGHLTTIGSGKRAGPTAAFSDEDFAVPGYLVTARCLFFQAGKRHVRKVECLRR